MPTYCYCCDNKECDKFEEEIFVTQKISEDRLTTCTTCNEDTLRKILKTAGIRLKGGGWGGKRNTV